MPRSRFARKFAKRIFTNREQPIAHFERARADLQPDQHRLLVYYGVGGQGKTALRRRLRDSGPIRTPIFDIAITRYWERTYPGEDLTRVFGDLLADPDGVFGGLLESAPDWVGLAEEMPAGIGLGLKALHYYRQKRKKREAEQGCDALADLERLEADQLAERLPWFLGLDLQTHRADHPELGAPILFLDIRPGTIRGPDGALPDRLSVAQLPRPLRPVDHRARRRRPLAAGACMR